jgi:hypothetical protein
VGRINCGDHVVCLAKNRNFPYIVETMEAIASAIQMKLSWCALESNDRQGLIQCGVVRLGVHFRNRWKLDKRGQGWAKGAYPSAFIKKVCLGICNSSVLKKKSSSRNNFP